MTAATKIARTDIYTRVTDRIAEQLSQGVRPWLKPWNAEHAAGRITRPLRHNGTPYKGINILMLWASAEEAGFVSPFWLTFQQAKELGGHVKKGEHGSPVVYAATFKKKEQGDDGQETEEEIPFLKEYTVFCADQCEGLPQHFYATVTPPDQTIEPMERAMSFFDATKAEIRIGGDRAYYAMDPDYVRIKRLTIDIPQSLHMLVKSQCVLRGVNMVDVVRDFLEREFKPEYRDEGTPQKPTPAAKKRTP